jgi:hypothetical protein
VQAVFHSGRDSPFWQFVPNFDDNSTQDQGQTVPIQDHMVIEMYVGLQFPSAAQSLFKRKGLLRSFSLCHLHHLLPESFPLLLCSSFFIPYMPLQLTQTPHRT